ncbi:MAG: monovalent cation/H+ antiporter complex subunit F [Clostridia bacterium]|nr:monovalent cation/H+ antiporter complex subunit F [Clostridia bacterium]MDD4047422.1 monovalent cation/H+ antiporter complex subunit F [Clostridia bacterium]
MLDNFFVVLMVGLIFIVMLMLFRVFKGPTVFDRLNGLGVIGTDAIVILVLLGFLEKRVDMYVDIAISYAILGFISLVVIAKYLEGKGDANS